MYKPPQLDCLIFYTYNSGSQTMAYVMALQQGWPTDKLKFQSKKLHDTKKVSKLKEGKNSKQRHPRVDQLCE